MSPTVKSGFIHSMTIMCVWLKYVPSKFLTALWSHRVYADRPREKRESCKHSERFASKHFREAGTPSTQSNHNSNSNLAQAVQHSHQSNIISSNNDDVNNTARRWKHSSASHSRLATRSRSVSFLAFCATLLLNAHFIWAMGIHFDVVNPNKTSKGYGTE